MHVHAACTQRYLSALQAEFRTITSVQPQAGGQGLSFTLDSGLAFSHRANLKAYPGTSLTLDARAEVAMVDSNVVLSCPDAAEQYATGGEKFGPYIRVAGGQRRQLPKSSAVHQAP